MTSTARRVVIEVSGTFAPTVPGGLRRRRVAELFGAFGRIRTRLDAEPVFPVIDAEAVAAAVAALGADGTVAPGVVGQPGAVRAVTVVSRALGRPVVRAVVPEDPALDGSRPWVALLGPPWVDDAVDQLVARGERVLVVGASGADDVEPPPGGAWLADDGAGDGRVAALGPAAIAVATLAGVAPERVRAGLDAARGACASPRFAEEPAWSWAAVAALAELDLGRTVQVHLTAEPALLPLARHGARAWGAALVGQRDEGPIRAWQGGRGFDGLYGDEELWEALLVGPSDVAVVSWELARAPDARARFVDGCVALAVARGIPVVRVRLADLDEVSLALALGLAHHASTVAALVLDRDPRRLTTLPALYAAAGVDAAEADE